MNSTNYNPTPQPVETIAGCIFDGLVASNAENAKVEAWIAALAKFMEDEPGNRVAQESRTTGVSRESRPPLQKVAEGPWRSLGGYFDYSDWPDRDRFMELDKLIASGMGVQEEDAELDVSRVYAGSGSW